MIELDDAVKYFNDCKPKYLRRFSEETPEGNLIKGWICRKPNRYLGSLLIDEVNGEAHVQFVQSMPKIEYLNDDMAISDVTVAYEKLDGSCLIIYPLFYDDGKILELVPKTRGRAVADKNFLELYNKCDHEAIIHYYYKDKIHDDKGVLFFEMYGILNQHEIIHYQTGIDLVLIGAYTDHFYNSMELWSLATRNLFKQPDEIFRFRNNTLVVCNSKYYWILDDVPLEEFYFESPSSAVEKIMRILEWLNATYNSDYGRIATEGVVINTTDDYGVQKYIKVKPRGILMKHTSREVVPTSAIRKECLKYFDEYGSRVKEIYNENPSHHTEYIIRMLSEEYDELYINISKKKIERVFMNVWNSKEVPESIHKICEDLIDEFGEMGLTHCMRMFAQRYPMKKKDARTIYTVLKSKGLK